MPSLNKIFTEKVKKGFYLVFNYSMCLLTLFQSKYLVNYFRRHKTKKPNHLKRFQWLDKSISQSAFDDFVRGKSVAVVGNAKSLLDSAYGGEIDANDIVIRINRAEILSPEAQGVRTDIWAASVMYEGMPEPNGYDLFFWVTPFFHSDMRYDEIFKDKHLYLQPHCVYDKLVKKINAFPTSGLMILNRLMESRACRKINLYGFDFFRTSNMYNNIQYKNGHPVHCFESEKSYVLELVQSSDNVNLNI